jgi:hypothetical protein
MIISVCAPAIAIRFTHLEQTYHATANTSYALNNVPPMRPTTRQQNHTQLLTTISDHRSFLSRSSAAQYIWQTPSPRV